MEEEIAKRKCELRKRIATLEWDMKMGQINPAMKAKLEGYKKEMAGTAIGQEDAKKDA